MREIEIDSERERAREREREREIEGDKVLLNRTRLVVLLAFAPP